MKKYLIFLLLLSQSVWAATNRNTLLTTNSLNNTQFNTAAFPITLTNLTGIGGIPAVVTSNYWTTNIAAANSLSNTFAADITVGTNINVTTVNKVKVYRALVSQTGGGAPVATTLENTIGSIVWGRTSPGLYTATLISAFTSNKTFVLATVGGGNEDVVISVARTSADVLTMKTLSIIGGDLEDGELTGAYLEILVYP